MPKNNSSKFVKIGEASKNLGVSIDTLRRWEKAGKIEVIRTPGKTRLYSTSSLNDLTKAPVRYQRVEKISIPQAELPKPQLSTVEELLQHLQLPGEGTEEFFDARIPEPEELSIYAEAEIPINSFTPGESKPTPGVLWAFSGVFACLIITSLLLARVNNFQDLFSTNTNKSTARIEDFKSESGVLAAETAGYYLNIKSDVAIEGSINGLTLTPNADGFTVAGGISASRKLTVLNGDVTLDQDVSTKASPSFVDLKLTAAAKQINMGGAGTLTWTPSGTQVITFPNATGNVVLDTATQTITNKTISGSSNTLSAIPNSALSNNKVTVTAGTNLSGGGDVALGSSITLTLKDSVALTGTLTMTGQILGADGTAAAPAYSFSADTNTGLYRLSADTIGLITGGTATQGITINSSGNAGIGTISPTQKLEVTGNALIAPSANSTTVFNVKNAAGTSIFAVDTTNSRMTSLGTQVIYLPDQTSYTGSIVFGDGGRNLSHTSGTDAFYNTFVGISAGTSNTTASMNTAMGYEALSSSTTGGANTAVGSYALKYNTTGYQNTAMGQSALEANTTGVQNTAVGQKALYQNTTASGSTAVGYKTLTSNTTGTANTAMGFYALYYTQTGGYNTAIGYQAGYGGSGSNFSNNSLFGYNVGYALTTGSNNILLGYQAGDNLTSGANNIILGYDIDAPSAASANTLNIGNLIFATGLDGTGTTLSSGNVGIGTTAPAAKLALSSTSTSGADFLITNTGISTSGSIGTITANSATTGDIFTLNGTALTSGSLLVLTGPSGGTAGVTDAGIKLTSDVGNIGTSNGLISSTATIDSTGAAANGINLYLSTANSNTTNVNTAYGVYNTLTDAVALANTNYGQYTSVSNTGALNAAATKTIYGSYITASGTGATTNASVGTNVYGQYVTTTASHASDNGTVNQYGLYVANGTSSTNGTSTKYGLYLEAPTGADTNYSIYSNGGTSYFAGDIGIATTTPDTVLDFTYTDTNTLHLKNTGATYSRISVEGATAGLDLVDSDTTANQKWFQIRSDGGILRFFNISDDGLSIVDGITLQASSGNVGIGTTAPAYKLDIATSTASDRGINIANTAATGTNYGIYSSVTGAATANIGGYFVSTGATTSRGLEVAAMTSATSTGLTIGALSGTTADTGINIGAISGTNATGTGITVGNISTTGTANYGLQLGTMTGGTTSNYQISTGVLTSATTTTNAQLNLGGVVTTGGTTNYGINVGALSGTGTTNYGVNVNTLTSVGTTNYGLNIGGATGAATTNYGLLIGAVSGASANNYGLYTTSGTTVLNATSGNVGIGTTSPLGLLHVAGQCVAKGTKIRRRRRRKSSSGVGSDSPDADDFEDVSVENIKPGDEILSLNEGTGKFEWRKVEKTWDKGTQTSVLLVTETGKNIETTWEHPYLVKNLNPLDNAIEEDSNSLFDHIFENTRQITQSYYFGPLRDFKFLVPTLDNEQVNISEEGWNHLHHKARSKAEMLTRYFALPKVAVILLSKESRVTHEKGKDNNSEFWSLYGTVDDIQLKVVIRSINQGPKHFYSVIWRGEAKIELEKGQQKRAASCLYPQCGGIITPQLFFETEISGENIESVTPGVDTWIRSSHGLTNDLYHKNLSLSIKEGQWLKVSQIKQGMLVATISGWEKIVLIKELDRKKMYDLQIEGTHNFVGNNIVAHNTAIFGAGEGGTPTVTTLRGAAASGTNIAGANFTFDASNGTGTGGSGALIFRTAPTAASSSTANTLAEIMRITPGGNVGIGTTNPINQLNLARNDSSAGITLSTAASAGGYNPALYFRESRGTQASPADVANGDYAMDIESFFYSGGTWFGGAYIQSQVSGTFTSGQRPPSNLIFGTNVANTAVTERLRITPAGNIGIGDTDPDYLLELYDATNTPTFALSDDDIAHGVTDIANTDAFFHLSSISTTDGGAYLQGIADNVVGVTALQLRGIQASDPTDTVPAIKLIAAKASGTGVVDLGAAETVFQVANNDDTAALTILGNGNVGIGTTSPAYKVDVTTSTASDRGINIANTASTGTNYGIYSSATGASTANIGGYFVSTGATTSRGLEVAAMTSATSTGLTIGALSGTTADTGINIGAISGTGATGTGITVGNISTTGTTNYGLQLGTMTGGTTSNYQISTGVLTSATTTTNAQLNLGGVVTTGGTTNYGINVGALSGTGTTNYGVNVNTLTSVGTTNYGLNIGGATGAATTNYGLLIGAVSGASANNYGLYTTSGTTVLNATSGNVGIGTTSPLGLLHVAGQCVTGDTKLKRRKRRKGKNGKWIDEWEDVEIKDIKEGDEILTLDEKTGKFVASKIKALQKMGIQDVYQLITNSGKKIRTTGSHPYLAKKPAILGSSGTFEADQSNRIEDLTKDSFIALSNVATGESFIASITSGEKRKAFKHYQKDSRFFGPILWARMIAYLIRKYSIHDAKIILDQEYPSYEKIIDQILDVSGERIFTEYQSIGRNSFAHEAVYEKATGKKLAHKKAIGALTQYVQVAEDMLHPEFTGIRTPSDRSDNLYHKIDHLSIKQADWIKVYNLELGWDIATLDGWEKIISLKKVAREQVFDIEVEGTHNFVGNNIVAHNTAIFGAGEGGTPTVTTLRGAAAAGTDIAGANFTFDASNGTGTGGSGALIFRTAPVAASSSTVNTLAEIMRITPGGNVGIGTTSPSSPLDVYSTVDSASARFHGNSITTGGAYIYSGGSSQAHFSGGMERTSGTWTARDTTASMVSATGGLAIFYTNSGLTSGNTFTPTERVRIDSSGNVGIGDTDPDYLLELYDTTNTPTFALSDDDIAHGVTTVANTDSFFHLSSISTTDGGAYLQGIADNVVGATALQLRGIQASDPTDTVPAIKLIGAKASGTGVVDLAAAETVFQVANNDDTAALTVLGNGNVGVGVVAPSAKLEVSQTDAANTYALLVDSAESTNTNDVFRVKSDYPGTDAAILNLTADGSMTLGASAANSKTRALLTTRGDQTLKGKIDLITSGMANVNSVFVYDTTKDADGGQWRNDERAKSASWYNETIDATGAACDPTTNNRCGRKEFPEKAILVVSGSGANGRLYIYDAKDNTLWMSFTGSTSGDAMFYLATSVSAASVFGLNGKIYVAANTSSGMLYTFDFPKDENLRTADNTSQRFRGKIADRGSAYSMEGTVNQTWGATYVVIDRGVNDVFARIINGKTYIAVATDNGLTVLNETDRIAYDYADNANDNYNQVWLDRDGNLWATNNTTATLEKWNKVINDSADENPGTPDATWDETTTPALTVGATDIQDGVRTAGALAVTDGTSTIDDLSPTVYLGTAEGLSVVSTKAGDETNSSVKYYTKDYITEELIGDTRAMWPLNADNAASDLEDVSVKTNNLTATNIDSNDSATGVRGTATDFDGSTENLSIPTLSDADLDFNGTESFSASFWVYPTTMPGTGEQDAIFSKWDATGAQRGYRLILENDDADTTGNFQVDVYDESADQTITATQPNDYVDVNTWYFVTITFNGGQAGAANDLKLYVNGVLNDGNDANASFLGLEDVTSDVVIGDYDANDAIATSTGFTGRIDEGMVTAEVLTYPQIKHIYEVGRRALDEHTASRITGVTGADNYQRLMGNASGGTTTSNNVTAVAVDDFNQYIYAGVSDAAGNTGGVTVLGIDSDSAVDLYDGTANTGKDDDAGTQFSANDVVAISVAGTPVHAYNSGSATGSNGAVLAIGGTNDSATRVWMESSDYSLYSTLATLTSPGMIKNDITATGIFQVFNTYNNYANTTPAERLSTPALSVDSSGNLIYNYLGASTSTTALNFTDTLLTSGTTMSLTGSALTSGKLLDLTSNTLTSGKMLNLSSSSTAMTGALELITLSGSNAANTGALLELDNTGTANTNTSFYIKHYATGTDNLAMRVDDVSGDTTPFVIDGTGAVGIGTTSPSALLAVGSTSQFNVTSAGAVTASGNATLGTGASTTNTFGSGASSINTIGSSTTPGALTLHGATTLDNTFTISGSNLTSLGGNLTVTGTAWTATPTISGLITATSGLTSNGTLTLQNNSNFTQTGSGTFGTGTGAVSLNGETTIASGKNLTLTSGNLTLSSGLLTQTGAGNNSFAGNVGIGTTGPAKQFVVSSSNKDLRLYTESGLGYLLAYDVGASDYYNMKLMAKEIIFGYGATGDNEAMRINSSGNVGIGTTTVNSKTGILGNLAVGATYGTLAAPTSGAIIEGNVGIGTTAPAAPLEVKAAGTGVIAKFTSNNTTGCTLADGGTISCSSDINLKKNIEDINYGLSDLMSLKPIVYNWKSDSDQTTRNLGFIAQDVEQIIPKLVTTDTSTGLKSLNTIGLIPVLTKSLQELNQKISLMENSYQIDVNGKLVIPEAKIDKLIISGDVDLGSNATFRDASFDSWKVSDMNSRLAGEVDVLSASIASMSAQIAELQSQVANNSATASSWRESSTDRISDSIATPSASLQNDVTSSSAGSTSEESPSSPPSEVSTSSGQTSSASATPGVSPKQTSSEAGFDSSEVSLQLTPPEILLATQSAQLVDLTVTSDATISGKLTAYDLSVQNNFKSLGEAFLGNTTVAGNFSVDGTMSITGDSLNSIACHSPVILEGASPIGSDSIASLQNDGCGTLFIQNSPLAQGVDFFNGLAVIDKTGKLVVQEIVAKTITTEKLVIKNTPGVDSIGEAIIPAGQTEIPIFTPMANLKSKVFLTPTTSTEGQSLIISQVVEETGFVVRLDHAVSSDIKFNWLIIDSQ